MKRKLIDFIALTAITAAWICVLMLIIAGISSCCPKIVPVSTDTSTVSHSSHHREVTERVKDSIVYLPADSASILALIECNEQGEAYIKQIEEIMAGRNVIPEVVIKDGVLRVNCRVDSSAVYLHWKERHVSERNDSTYRQTITIRKTAIVNKLKWYQTTLVWVGVAALIGGILWILWKIYGSRIKQLQ